MAADSHDHLFAHKHPSGYALGEAWRLCVRPVPQTRAQQRRGDEVRTKVEKGPVVRIIAARGDDACVPVPLQPTAFIAFADSCTSEEGVASFANQYGLLGFGEPIEPFTYANADGDEVQDYTSIEPVETWVAFAAEMRTLRDYWDALKAPRFRAIDELTREYFWKTEVFPGMSRRIESPETTPEGGVTFPKNTLTPTLLRGDEAQEAIHLYQLIYERSSTGGARAGANTRGLPAPRPTPGATPGLVLNRTTKERLRRLGWMLLGLAVTAKLRQHGVAPAIVSLAPASAARVRRMPEKDLMGIQFTAHTLIGALWLQFALAVTRRYEYRHCEGCGATLTIHPDHSRSNRRTCSDRCRQLVSRTNRSGKRPRASRGSV